MNKYNNGDLNLLNVFRLMIEMRSVSKVAHKVGVSQSALSHSLKKLRVQFEDPLFHKTALGMEPSQRALEIYRAIKEPLANLTSALQVVQVFDPKLSQHTFVLGTSDYFEKLLLAPIIQHFNIEAPSIKLRCVNYDDLQLNKELIDVDLVFGRYTNPPENLYKQTLWLDSFVTLVAKNHSRIIKDKITLKQFINEKHILISPTGSGTSMVDVELAKLGLTRNIALTSRLFNTPVEIVETSEMITTMPERLAKHSTRQEKVKLLSPPISMQAFEVNMLWGPLKHKDPAHQWLRQTILTVAKKTFGKE
jgi:DNA-binding transcriptional LysR family regulator